MLNNNDGFSGLLLDTVTLKIPGKIIFDLFWLIHTIYEQTQIRK